MDLWKWVKEFVGLESQDETLNYECQSCGYAPLNADAVYGLYR